MDAIEESVTSIFHEVFRRKDIVLKPETTAFDIRGWDSLTNLKIVFALEKKFGIKFEAREVVAMKNVGDLFNIVRQKTSAKAKT